MLFTGLYMHACGTSAGRVSDPCRAQRLPFEQDLAMNGFRSLRDNDATVSWAYLMVLAVLPLLIGTSVVGSLCFCVLLVEGSLTR